MGPSADRLDADQGTADDLVAERLEALGERLGLRGGTGDDDPHRCASPHELEAERHRIFAASALDPGAVLGRDESNSVAPS